MGLFRRDAKRAADEVADGTVVEETGSGPDEVGTDEAGGTTAAPGLREHGPWDSEEEHEQMPRVDLGALRLPTAHGMELRMEIDRATNIVSAATIAIDGSTLQLQAFAAPRTEGIWDEIRDEIRQSVEQQGGSADDLPGPFGRELLARLPVRTPEGRTGHRPARFLGVDGPRWFLRGVVSGKAAVDPAAAEALERVFGDIVVVRDSTARAPRDLLALTLPTTSGGPAPAPAATEEAESAPSFDPLTRGPEITETR